MKKKKRGDRTEPEGRGEGRAGGRERIYHAKKCCETFCTHIRTAKERTQDILVDGGEDKKKKKREKRRGKK